MRIIRIFYLISTMRPYVLYKLSSKEKLCFNQDRSDEVERIHALSQQLIQKPNRTCLSDVHNSTDFVSNKFLLLLFSIRFSQTIRNERKILCRIIPSQNILFELAQHKPDINRWTSTFQNEETVNDSIVFKEPFVDDDGFQSASSSLSDEKSKLAFDDFDHWSRALTQAENKYFTWEQRGR